MWRYLTWMTAGLLLAGCVATNGAAPVRRELREPPATAAAPNGSRHHVGAAQRSATPPSVSVLPVSFDAAVLPPPLPDLQTAPNVALRQICAYLDWLAAHHPDPALVAKVALPGSEFAQRMAADLADLRSHHYRAYDVAAHYRVVRTHGGHAGDLRFIVSESLVETRVVNAHGAIVRVLPYPHGLRAVDTLTTYQGHWVLAAVVRLFDSQPIVVLP